MLKEIFGIKNFFISIINGIAQNDILLFSIINGVAWDENFLCSKRYWKCSEHYGSSVPNAFW